MLLRAMLDVPGAQLTVLGEGAGRDGLEQLVRQLGLAERVRLPGWSENVAAELGACDVLVLPSRSEGWPLTVVEAMLMGLPVVASTVGSIPEAVQDGRTGLLVPSDDPVALAAALRRLRDDQGLRVSLGAAGRRSSVACMTAPRMAQQWLALWQEVLVTLRRSRYAPPQPRP